MRSSLGIGVLCSVLVPSLTLIAQPARAQCPPDVGAAIAAACPCDGTQQGGAWRNHGKYQSCVVRERNRLRKQGCLTAETQRTIARCAAKSTCGRKNDAVLCCTYPSTGTCNDLAPGDGLKEGTCSNDATIACDTDADCTVLSKPSWTHDATWCAEHGRYVSGTGSMCAGCQPPPAP
jgi:hypothetical protein